jgi:general secretion pathway protein J
VVAMHYGLAGGVLRREIGGAPQRLLSGVSGLRWRFYEPGVGWIDRWPPDPERSAEWPAAVAAELVLPPGLPGPAGNLRRVVSLPARP